LAGFATNAIDARLVPVTSKEPRRAEFVVDVLDASASPPADVTSPGGGIAELFQARHVGLVRLATLLVGDQATAEDVVQDVFTRVCARADQLAGNDIGLSYFRTAVVNACRSVHRRRGIARRLGGSVEVTLWSEPTGAAEAEVLLAEDRRQVLLALAALPRRQREALVLRYYQRLSEADIAETMGISRGTVKSTLSRGLDALGGKLGKEMGDDNHGRAADRGTGRRRGNGAAGKDTPADRASVRHPG
jgi:RNA polymerase sigma-70 factor (sigma-E family)